jgi:hypothetical protein
MIEYRIYRILCIIIIIHIIKYSSAIIQYDSSYHTVRREK